MKETNAVSMRVIVTPKSGETIEVPNAVYNALIREREAVLWPAGYATFGQGYVKPTDPVKLTEADYTLARFIAHWSTMEMHARQKFWDRMREYGIQDGEPACIEERNKDAKYQRASAVDEALWSLTEVLLTPVKRYAVTHYAIQLVNDNEA